MEEEMLPEPKDLKSEPNKCNTSCGLGSWTPNYLQKFANPNFFFIFYCLTGTAQGAYFTYLIGIMSTLERRYSFGTWVTGVILIADNISPLLFSVIVGFYGKHVHRPMILGTGMILNVFCCFLSSLPYFLHGSVIKSPQNISNDVIGICADMSQPENCDDKKLYFDSVLSISCLFIANFFKGLGSIAYYTIGTPYLDDNVKKKNSPIYLGATFAMRIFGPTLGFLLSSFCLQFYEDPFIDPGFGPKDSQWIGAWWIGFLIIGFILMLTSVPILFFPRYMPNIKMCIQAPSSTSISDLFMSLWKLIRNPILLFHTLSIIFQINGLFGYFAFMPKYIENQFQNSASSASFFSGTVTLFGTAPSAFLGGLCISKLKPRPRTLTGYMLSVQVVAFIAMGTSIFMSCQKTPFSHDDPYLYHEKTKCNEMCSCRYSKIDPVCDTFGETYFSACNAGCRERGYSNNIVTFKNCSCIAQYHQNINFTMDDIQATKGICSEDCQKFLPYIIIITVAKILASTVRVGNLLITLRCVDEVDKSLALGAVEFFISIFATIPYPLLYGYVIDQSCLKWDLVCGNKGHCLFYDFDWFRFMFHALSMFFIFLGVCCDFVVFLLSSRMTNLYDDNAADSNKNVEFIALNGLNVNNAAYDVDKD